MALALVKELRHDFGLPAYILRKKDYPGGSMIRGVPPTVPSEVKVPDIKYARENSNHRRSVVLVGNEKTLADSEKLWRKVKKLKPKCMDGMSSPYRWRTGLSSALRTTNPYVPAQLLYPRPNDKLVIRMNSGLRSIANCPGSLQSPGRRFLRAVDVPVRRPGAAVLPASRPEEQPAAQGSRRRRENG